MSGPGKGADRRSWERARTALAAGAPAERFVELAAASKAARKGVAAALSGDDGAAARAALAELADVAPDLPVDRLLRLAAGREADARRRSNPIPRNEAFECAECGLEVEAGDGFVRNHCPRCLCSLHVDGDVPGDRASACGGVMEVASYETRGGLWIVTHRCRRCGHERRNRLYPDAASSPDSLDALPGPAEP